MRKQIEEPAVATKEMTKTPLVTPQMAPAMIDKKTCIVD
jgi:hypothetical protein